MGARHEVLHRRLRDQVPGLDVPRWLDALDVKLDTTGDRPRLSGSVDPRSIAVKDENLHAHLQSPEFFDSERHPAITFQSTARLIDADELVIDGNLTIKGDTRPVQAHGTFTVPHEYPWGNTRLGITLEASVDRAHFGLNWNTPLPKGGLALANDVRLHVDLQLSRRNEGPGNIGSLRRDSHNTRLLRTAGTLLPPGAELVLWEELKPVPAYDADDDPGEPRPWVLRSLDEAIRESDVVLLATPEYNHSIPGQLKNALDWLSRPLATSPLRDKPVAVVGASTGLFGAVWAQAEPRRVLAAIGARVIDHELPLGVADDAFTETGRLKDGDLELVLVDLPSELLADVCAATMSA